MKNIFLFIGLISNMVSCNNFFAKSQHNHIDKNKQVCIDKLKLFAERNWKYIPSENYFDASQIVFDSLRGCAGTNDTLFRTYSKCLSTLTMMDVESIFGTAHEKSVSALLYYNTPGWEKSTGMAGSTKFTFDTPNKTLRCIWIF